MITFDKVIKDLATEREKCVASIKTLERLDNVPDVENVINVLKEKVNSINEELQKYVYCAVADEDDVINFLKGKIEFSMKQVLGSDTITEYYMKDSVIYNKILNDLTTYYSLTKDTNITLVEEGDYITDEMIEELPDEEDHDEYLRYLADDLTYQNQEPSDLVKDTDEDED